MPLKDVLVYVDQSDSSSSRLRLAADLAWRNRSRLTALFVKTLAQSQLEARCTAELALASPAQLDRLEHSIEDSIDRSGQAMQTLLRNLANERGVDAEWRCAEGLPATVVAQHARYADLCIVGHDGAKVDSAVDYSFSERVLFATGRPVLFVPVANAFASLGRHIVVAWNSSRASARALHDALPLIEHADKATLLAINPSRIAKQYGALSLDHMLEHLKRHGRAVSAIAIEDIKDRNVADVLQNQALELGSDLLVAGAFGHARIQEKLLGGVTHDLLARMQLPLMMSY
jgi:nucleotide-binding universal stress UspA family protein